NGRSLFGRAEGVRLLGAIPPSLQAEVYFKDGTGLSDQKFQLRQENAVAEVTAYSDVAALPADDLDAVTRAVGRNIMIGRGDIFDAYDGLWRGELGRALALAAWAPQRIPAKPSFTDVGFFTPCYPSVERVAGA